MKLNGSYRQNATHIVEVARVTNYDQSSYYLVDTYSYPEKVEIYFSSFKGSSVSRLLRSYGFWWNSTKRCWWQVANRDTVFLASKMCEGVSRDS